MIDRIRTEEGGGLVFVTGDFNVNYRNDKIRQDPIFPYAALGTRALRSSYYKLGEPATGTHVLDNGFDKRLIDYVNFKPTRRVIATGQRIMRGMNSDHRPLIVDFKITTTRLLGARRADLLSVRRLPCEWFLTVAQYCT